MNMKYLLIVCFLFQLSSLSASAQEFKYHTVEAGETVYSISKSYNISEEAIYKYNPDSKNNLEISSKLVIPLSEKEELSAENQDIQFITHTVKRKETLYRLSKDYNVEIDEIKRFNKHLYSEELQRGEEILIPQPKQGATNTEIASSENLNLPATNKPQTSETREHVVLPKETKYGIARKYGLTVKELEELNPKVDVLHPGVMIRVGTDVLDEPVILTDEVFEFYEVKPKETLFGLSRKFDVPQDSLISLNPALEDGLKIGMVLKVPNTGEGEGNLEEGEIEELAGAGSEDANTRLDLSNKLSNFNTKELVVLLPYSLNNIDSDSISNYKDAILEDRVLRISLDFYSGVRMAVEKAKSLGISTQLKTYDTRRSVQEVTNIINSNDFSNVDAVIGPLLQNTIEAAASKLTQYNVPVISPLSDREMRSYQNLFQSRPTNEIMKNAMFDYLERNAIGKNVIIIADGAKNQVKNELIQILPDSRVILPSEAYLSAEKIEDHLSETQENWVILESSNIGLLSSATSALNRLARDHQIKLFTTERNSGFEDDIVDNQHLGRLNFHYPSVDKEFGTTSSDEFIENYKEEFDMIPNQYVIRGYDLTMDVLLRLASSKDLYESFEKHRGFTEYHENKFHYSSKPNGGFYNDAVYIMTLDEELNLNVANDQ